jgi:hypothetical protein
MKDDIMSTVESVGKKYKSLILVMATPLLSGYLHVGRIVVAM